MAEEAKFKARSWYVFFNNGTYEAPDWLPFACLTSNDLDSQLDAIDATSKCGDDQQPGDSFQQKVNVEGFSLTVAGAPTKASASKIYDLHYDKTVFDMLIARLEPVADEDYNYRGYSWVSSFKETGQDKEMVTFSAEFTVQNPPLVKTIETA